MKLILLRSCGGNYSSLSLDRLAIIDRLKRKTTVRFVMHNNKTLIKRDTRTYVRCMLSWWQRSQFSVKKTKSKNENRDINNVLKKATTTTLTAARTKKNVVNNIWFKCVRVFFLWFHGVYEWMELIAKPNKTTARSLRKRKRRKKPEKNILQIEYV